jgi:2-polyprenyl-6-methoxyphenol hydroxylase-like FAD-dependent oxidoreductase
MKIAIVGGGIGGLTAALMLGTKGFECTVYEQAPDIRELGVGINVLPHAVKKLSEFGLIERLRDVAIETDELFYTNRFGQTVWTEPRGIAAGYAVPQFSIHRGRLQKVLLDAVGQHLGPVVRTGHRLSSFEQSEDSVHALFDTQDGPVFVDADALIGADGIHSIVRKAMFPGEGPPSWNGIMIWRGATDWPSFLSGRSMVIAGGMQAKVVVYPIARGANPDLRLTNWTVNVRLGDGSAPLPRREDWSRPGMRSELMNHVQRFSIPYLDVNGLLDATREFWEYPMCDRDPLPFWSQQRVTLLGDAAHPMYPTGSNGAGQAILDADALTHALTTTKNVASALKSYDDIRRPATAEVVRRNRLGGPERVIDIVEQRAPDGFDNIDTVMSFGERKKISDEYATTAGFSKESVNA